MGKRIRFDKSNGVARTTVIFPPEVMPHLRIAAILKDTTISEVVLEYVRTGLDKDKEWFENERELLAETSREAVRKILEEEKLKIRS